MCIDMYIHAAHIIHHTPFITHIYTQWSFEQGAAFLVQALTALYGLKSLGDLQPGARVLIQSAAGGVGLQAVAICLACKAIPVCLVGSESKIPTLVDRFPQLDPATQIFVRPSTGPAFAQLLESINCEYDLVFDAVAGPFFQPAYDRLAKGGRYIVYGAASMTPQGDRVGWLRLAWQVGVDVCGIQQCGMHMPDYPLCATLSHHSTCSGRV